MTFDPISLTIGLLAGLIVAGLVAAMRMAALRERLHQYEQARQAMGDTFSTAAQEALARNNEQFLALAQEKLKAAQAEGAHDIEKRQKAITEMVDPIGKMLTEMNTRVEGLGKTGIGLDVQLKAFAEDQRMLRQETQNLVQALRNPAARGRWGEMQLERAFETIGMIEGTHYTQQQSATADGSAHRPDFIIMLPGGMRIIVDVKTPIEPYWDAMDSAASEAAQTEALDNFRRKLRDHLKVLKSREYWRHFDGSPEFVVMFLPTEGLYSMAVSNDPALIEDAANANVILASPTTLMGLLRVAMHGWQQQKIAEEAKNISELAADLYNRIGKFGEHMQKVGANLGRAMGSYNDAVGSLERMVLPGARKFKELHVQTGGREISELPALEIMPQSLSAPELLAGGGDTEETKPKKRA